MWGEKGNKGKKTYGRGFVIEEVEVFIEGVDVELNLDDLLDGRVCDA